MEIHNPKRDKSCEIGTASWYPYYAGYSQQFVEDAIDYATTRQSVRTVLDPWNGSGTTTDVAYSRGLEAFGFDLNPVMVIVAKAKTLDWNIKPSIRSLLEEICQKARSQSSPLHEDPLGSWFSSESVSAFRSIDRAIFALLVQSDAYVPVGHLKSLDLLSALAAYFYLALFRSVRSTLSPFIGSNPTWIKVAPSVEELLHVPFEEVLSSFRREAIAMELAMMPSTTLGGEQTRTTAKIQAASSSCLPLPDHSLDLVISSPPYCTRIDYAVKTKPELALLGLSTERFRDLRDSMLGTPTIGSTPNASESRWGVSCNATLDQIFRHSAKASRSYYWKTYIQYFSGLFSSIKEIERVLEVRGSCFLVVQDSYYKDLHIDLARICKEMAAHFGLSEIRRIDYESKRSMVRVNPAARQYTKRHNASESILIWQRQ